MNITICGGGNLGHTCAGMLSLCEGVNVNVLTNRPSLWANQLTIELPSHAMVRGKLGRVTSSPAETIPDSELVLLCLPAYLVEGELKKILPWLGRDTIVGSVVGNTGFFFFAHEILPATQPLFAFQRVPYISRIEEYGHSARLLGTRPELLMALENVDDAEGFRCFTERLFGEKVVLVDNFYEVTLSNSNPILHTGRLYTMWNDWNGKPFDRCPLFYKEWTDEASALEIKMDKEFFHLLRALGVSTAHIDTLLHHYESTDAASLTRKIRSIESLSGILSPMKEVDGGWVPDFGSRYFTEDFPYGLRFIHKLARLHGLETPHIDDVSEWGLAVLGK